ncbi:MAG: NAD(P)-binding protein [Scytonema sp. PMC 1069.18]|nr:NAD(P)-binding protein [Scytonema sp. PMC 1069.18]MEC4883242.1 NAD(P)-binding protein [Scytonema sp. PMC 1070.18]
MQRALIIGGGVAGLSCAHLLAQHGWEVKIWGKTSHNSPTVLLNDTTCYLLQDIWQLEESFWKNFYVLNQRQVCWGIGADVLNIPQPSVVMNGNYLVKHLEKHLLQKYHQLVHLESPPSLGELASSDFLADAEQQFTWVIDASGRKSVIGSHAIGSQRHHFGHRCILSQELMLTAASEQTTSWIETVPDGWLFLAPLGENKALLQCMVPITTEEPEKMLTLLEQTRFIKTFVDTFLDSTHIFEAFPQISDPLCGSKWIAVGDAAFSLDPISGDGTGYALRGAILAISVINSIASGLDKNKCLQHYTLRLRKTFSSHLQQCLKYYSNSFSSSTWKKEIALMNFLPDNLSTLNLNNCTYKLENFHLKPSASVETVRLSSHGGNTTRNTARLGTSKK